MPKSFQRFLYASLIPAPFLLAMWVVLAWVLFQPSVTGFLGLFITVPASFIQMAILGLMLWLRSSIRLRQEFRGEDALWYVATFLLWASGAVFSEPLGTLLQLGGFVVGIVGMARIGKVSRDEAVAEMSQRADYLRQQFGENPSGPFPNATGPGAGRVIIIDSDDEWQEPTGPRQDSPSSRRPIEGEIIAENDRDDDDPDVEEWRARPRST